MKSTIKLLLAEDDEIQVVLFRELVGKLDGLDITVTHVTTLTEAQQRLDDEAFDLIIADLSLPDASAMQTVDGLIAHAGGLPVVVMSGESRPALVPAALARGAQGFVSKQNVTGTELRRVVEQSILRKRYVDDVISDMSRDPLTGVWDRAAFSKLLHTVQKSNAPYGVLFIDVNEFKLINDTLGHGAGDEILVRVVERMSNAIRVGDEIGRWGGDEFAILVSGIDSDEQLRSACIRINGDVNGHVILDDGSAVSVTVSCGAAFAAPGADPKATIYAADRAMYKAKKSSLRIPRLASDTKDGSESLVSRSIAEDSQLLEQADFWYQPMVDLNANRMWGYEALARWSDQNSTKLNLRRILTSSFASEFAAATIAVTCQALVRELHKPDAPPIISFNLHAVQFAAPDVVRNGLNAVLAGAPIPPEQLQVELTDASQLLGNHEAIEVLEELHNRGVRIAIDDFCDEQSTFEVLLRFPVDAIKIDRSITSQLAAHPMAPRIVASLVHLCGGSVDLIAEGVETQEQSNQLLKLGVALQQGFLHGRPAKILPRITAPRDGDTQDQHARQDRSSV